MLTIKRNNPHKKISVGLFSVVFGFISAYGLLSAMEPTSSTASTTKPTRATQTVRQEANLASVVQQEEKNSTSQYSSDDNAVGFLDDRSTQIAPAPRMTRVNPGTAVGTMSQPTIPSPIPTDIQPDADVGQTEVDVIPDPQDDNTPETIIEIVEGVVTPVLPIR